MHGDFIPQAQPHLRLVDTRPAIATGSVDPCIVYLETTLPGEIPLLVAFWAASSDQVRDSAGGSYLELKNVIIVRCRFSRPSSSGLGKTVWRFESRREDNIRMQHLPKNVLQAVRYLDCETDASLRQEIGEISDQNLVAGALLGLSGLDWASVTGAREALRTRHKKQRPPSLLRRVISSVFKKKRQPVPA